MSELQNERAVIGGNGAPFDFFEFFDLVVNSSATTSEKLLALITGRHIGRNGEAAYPSRARLIAQASISENTFQRSVAALRIFFDVEQRKGRATLYRPKPIITADELEEAIKALPPKSTPQNGVHPKKDTPKWEVGTPQNGATVYPILGRQKDPLKDPLKKDSPNACAKTVAAVAGGIAATIMPVAAEPLPIEQVIQHPAECWQTARGRLDAGMNAHEARAQRQVWVTPLGCVEVAGDFRAELVSKYPLVDLRCGLDAASPNVKTDHGAIRCMQDIRRQFGYMQQDAKRREAKPAAPPGKPKSEAQEWHEKQAAALRYIRLGE